MPAGATNFTIHLLEKQTETRWLCRIQFKYPAAQGGGLGYSNRDVFRNGSGCTAPKTYNSTTGECVAPVQPDGTVCTDESVPPPRVYQAGQCITLSTASQATQCKYFATGSLPQQRKVWIVEGEGDPRDVQIGKDDSGCEISSTVQDLEKDCVYKPAVQVPPSPGAGENGEDLPGYTSQARWRCTVSSTLTGNVAPNTNGIKPSDKICGDPGSPACLLEDLPKDTEQKPCIYKTNAAGEQICTSSWIQQTPGKEKCGYVNAVWKCAEDLPKAVGEGLFISTNVKTENTPDGKTKTTKTDKLTETTCKAHETCTSKTSTSTTVTIKDGQGQTESTSGSCTGPHCADQNTNPDADGDGFGDCVGDDCGDGAGEGGGAQDWYTPTEDTYASVFADFKDRVAALPVLDKVENFLSLNPSGTCPGGSYVVWEFTIQADQWCGNTIPWAVIAAVVLAAAAFLSYRVALL